MGKTSHAGLVDWIIDVWMPTVLDLANAADGTLSFQLAGIRVNLRKALLNVINGMPGPGLFPGGPTRFELPLKFLRAPKHGAQGRNWAIKTPKLSLTGDGLDEETEYTLYAIVALLSDEAMARRLRCCDQCTAFFFANANHRRVHNFCSEECRRKFDHAHRDTKAMAAYMRSYRSTRRKLSQKK